MSDKKFFVFLLISIANPVFAYQKLNLKADYIEYTSEYIYARGNVNLIYSEITLNCNELMFYPSRQQVQANGDVTLVNKDVCVKGENVFYNLEIETGTVSSANVVFEPWYCYGPYIEIISPQIYEIKDGFFTTCELYPPHYKLTAKQIIVHTDDKITAKNIVFYAGKIPLFYLPFYRQSLKEKDFGASVRVGTNEREGPFLRFKYGYKWNENNYSDIFLDYFTYQGLGGGTLYKYDYGEKMRGSWYGYYIQEADTNQKRWQIEASHWQKISPGWKNQIKVNYLSDWEFPRYYREEESELVRVAELDSEVAFTYTAPFYFSRIYWDKREELDSESKDFVKEYEYLPGLSFSTYKLPISRTPFYYSFNLNSSYFYNKKNQEFQPIGDTLLNLSAPISFFNKHTISPEVDLSEDFVENSFAYKTNFGFNSRWTNFFQTNFNYYFQPFETNGLSFSYLYKQGPNLRLTSKGNYDFKNESFAPLTTQYEYKNNQNSFYLRNIYKIEERTNYNFEAEYNWNPSYRWSFMFRTVYLDKLREQNLGKIDITNGFNFWLTPKTKIEFSIRYDLLNDKYRIKDARYSEHRIALYQNLHCWETSIVWKKHPDQEELWFLLNLTAFPKDKGGVYYNVEEREFQLRRAE